MGCLEQSRQFFLQYAQLELEARFPELAARVAAGRVGNGSECFGYDDEISKDHDWGVDFQLWVLEEDRERIPTLTAWKMDLLRRQGLSDSEDWFLASHGESVQRRIQDVRVRSLPLQFE